MAPARLALLPTTTGAATQGLLPTLLRLPLVASGMIEVIRFHRPVELAMHLVGEGRIPQPPAPAIARPDVDAHFPGNAPGRAGETAQKRRENPVRQRPLALVEQGASEVSEGALAAMAPGAFASRAVVVRAPVSNVVALAARTLQRTVFPPQRVDVGLALFSIEEVVHMREDRHG